MPGGGRRTTCPSDRAGTRRRRGTPVRRLSRLARARLRGPGTPVLFEAHAQLSHRKRAADDDHLRSYLAGRVLLRGCERQLDRASRDRFGRGPGARRSQQQTPAFPRRKRKSPRWCAVRSQTTMSRSLDRDHCSSRRRSGVLAGPDRGHRDAGRRPNSQGPALRLAAFTAQAIRTAGRQLTTCRPRLSPATLPVMLFRSSSGVDMTPPQLAVACSAAG